MIGFIDRLHVNSDILVIFISFLFFCTFFLCGANRLCVRLSLLSHEFEQFGSLHMCAPRKDIGRSGTQTRYPQTLSQPRYQCAILTPDINIIWAPSENSVIH